MAVSGENTASSVLQTELPDRGPYAPEAPARWNTVTRVVFRFLFVYLSLMCLNILSVLVQISVYFASGKLTPGFVDPLWRAIVPWFALHFFRLKITINGRGDSAFDWMLIVFFLCLAAIGTLSWSLLDPKRLQYARLYSWLRVEVRLALAGAMIIYGVDKVFPLQFGAMGLSRLAGSVGDLTPEGMLWVFMASSTGYTILSGLGELTSAVLLIIPRFANLGAIVCMGVMANVFALNVFYDVPVKIYAFHYLMMAVFLLAPELPRLANVLVLNRSVGPAVHRQLFHSRIKNRSALVAQLVLGGGFLGISLHATHNLYVKREQTLAVKSPLYGIWTVNDFEAAGNPASLSGEKQWDRLIFEMPGSVYVESKGGEERQAKLALDSKQNTLVFTAPPERNLSATFHFRRPQPSELVLDGDIGSTKVHATLSRVDESKFALTATGRHWVQ